jgi:phosphoenolpyruvate phosphomutase
VVAGYRNEAIDVQGATVVVNPDWKDSSELASLACALDAVSDDTVLIYGDLLFRSYILNNMMDWDAELLVAVDSSPLDQAEGNINDLAWCSHPDDRAMYQQKVVLRNVDGNRGAADKTPDGRWIGMLRISGRGREKLLAALGKLRDEPNFNELGVPDLINRLIEDGHAPQVQYISGHWMDINNLQDLQRAGEFAHNQRG